jgi:hypothetical protein
MKKIQAILLAAVAVLPLAGSCGSPKEVTVNEQVSPEAEQAQRALMEAQKAIGNPMLQRPPGVPPAPTAPPAAGN